MSRYNLFFFGRERALHFLFDCLCVSASLGYQVPSVFSKLKHKSSCVLINIQNYIPKKYLPDFYRWYLRSQPVWSLLPDRRTDPGPRHLWLPSFPSTFTWIVQRTTMVNYHVQPLPCLFLLILHRKKKWFSYLFFDETICSLLTLSVLQWNNLFFDETICSSVKLLFNENVCISMKLSFH